MSSGSSSRPSAAADGDEEEAAEERRRDDGDEGNRDGRTLESMVRAADVRSAPQSSAAEYARLRGELLRSQRAIKVLSGEDLESVRHANSLSSPSIPLTPVHRSGKL